MKTINNEEMVILYDENNQKISGYYNRYKIPKNKGYYYGVNIWLITNSKKIIIQKRSSNKEVYPNKFECVSGGVIKDESVSKACIREIHEELDLTLNETNLIKIDFNLDKKHNYFMHTFIYLLEDKIIEKIKINKSEISEIKIVNFNKLVEMIKTNKFADSIKNRFKKYSEIMKEKINDLN